MENTNGDHRDALSASLLAQPHEEFSFSGREPLRALSLTLCRQARRKVMLFSHQLDPYSYNNREMAETLKTLLLSSPYASLHILLQDHDPVRQQGHRLLELAQRLSSRVSIFRPLRQEHLSLTANYLIIDEVGFIYQPLSSRPAGTVSLHQPQRARELLHGFQDIWQQSEADSLLRRLSL
jgi:hypothetical protein